MRGVLLAAPDRQRGTRQRDGEDGSEQYGSSHSDSLVVATVADARRRFEHTPAPEGVQSARENESDRRDHRGQGRAAHDAEEERLGRVDDERDGQRRATLDLASWLGLGLGLGLWLVSRAPRARVAAAAGSERAPARPRRARRDRASAGASARARAARDKRARAPGRSRGLPRRPCPMVSAFRYAHLECAEAPTNAKRPLPVAAENGRRRCRGEVGGNPAVPCSRGRPAGSCPRRGISAPDRAIPWPSRRSGRVAEGGALLRRYGGEFLHRGFESLLLRSRVPRFGWARERASYAVRRSERWQSGRMRRSRKPLRVVRLVEGSNPSLSAQHRRRNRRTSGGSGAAGRPTPNGPRAAGLRRFCLQTCERPRFGTGNCA